MAQPDRRVVRPAGGAVVPAVRQGADWYRLAPTRPCSSPATPATAAIGSTRACSRPASCRPTGGERILAIFGPGAVIGELSMIDGAPRSASVTAIRDAKLQFVSRVRFDAFGADSPDVYKHLVTLLAGRLRDTNGALIATSFLSVKGRVARALLSLVGGLRPRRRRRPHPGAAEGDAERPRRHGRHRPRERQPRAAGLDEAQGREPARGLLLPGEQGGSCSAKRTSRSHQRLPLMRRLAEPSVSVTS